MYFKNRLVSQADLADVLNVSKITIWRMLKREQLPKMITIGCRLKRWDRDEITKWIKDAGVKNEKV
jgi:predicted DNA-binding transcriptional regulator AlpA